MSTPSHVVLGLEAAGQATPGGHATLEMQTSSRAPGLPGAPALRTSYTRHATPFQPVTSRGAT